VASGCKKWGCAGASAWERLDEVFADVPSAPVEDCEQAAAVYAGPVIAADGHALPQGRGSQHLQCLVSTVVGLVHRQSKAARASPHVRDACPKGCNI
jgi:hypothetical protein